MRTLQRTVIAVVTLCCILALPSGAAAQSSQGAEVVDALGCEETPLGTTICFEGRHVINATETPAGMVSLTLISDTHQVFVDGVCAGSTSDFRRVEHELVSVEGLQQSHTLRMQVSEADCGGGVIVRCEEFILVQYVNGRLVLVRDELVCTEL
jgi:hypothetical protein